jgi:hypothetical protein
MTSAAKSSLLYIDQRGSPVWAPFASCAIVLGAAVSQRCITISRTAGRFIVAMSSAAAGSQPTHQFKNSARPNPLPLFPGRGFLLPVTSAFRNLSFEFVYGNAFALIQQKIMTS